MSGQADAGAPPAGAGLWGGHVRMGEAEAARIAWDSWRFEGTAVRVDTEKDDTFVLSGPDGPQRVLKVTNPAEDLAEVDFEVQVLAHVGESAHAVPVPDLYPDGRGRLLAPLVDAAGQVRHARLMSYVRGTPLDATGSSPRERERVGEVLGRLRLATADFTHPAQDRVLAWDVQHLMHLAPLLDEVSDPVHRDLLGQGLDRFRRVLPVLPGLRRQVLHNDFSRSNLVVDHDDPRFVTGVIDFGDAVRTAIAVDVATALVNQLPRQTPDDADRLREVDLFADGRDVLRGYVREADLTATELAVVPYLVLGRVVARALITLRRAALLPANTRYILRNTEQGWGQLRWFLAQDDATLEHLLDCAAPSSAATPSADPTTGTDS